MKVHIVQSSVSQRATEHSRGGPQAEVFFWSSLDFWDENKEIKDSFKVITFFGLHLTFGTIF